MSEACVCLHISIFLRYYIAIFVQKMKINNFLLTYFPLSSYSNHVGMRIYVHIYTYTCGIGN